MEGATAVFAITPNPPGTNCASGYTFPNACFPLLDAHANFVSAPAGMDFDLLKIEAFCDNLTDSHTITNYEWSINSQVPGISRLQRDYTFRPRTVGLTFIYRMK